MAKNLEQLRMLYSSKAKLCDSASCGGATDAEIDQFRDDFCKKYSTQPEFLQAHGEICESLRNVFKRDRRYLEVFKIVSEPERIIQFRVLWQDDQGKIQCNTGYRVQYNSAIGPYKGGLRLHPSVNLSVLKFLGFEQIFKNALTGLNMGGAKGGSDFDPKDKSDMEIRSFCQSFMTELYRHIGAEVDVPAGDIGTGGREIGFLYGQYHRLRNMHHGVLTGKGLAWGGSNIRPEATGYGAVYYAEYLYKHFKNQDLSGKPCMVSGSGNAAQYTCEKLIELGAKVVTVSDSNGTLVFKNGMSREQLCELLELKNTMRGRLSQWPVSEGMEYHPNCKPWGLDLDCECAFPAATQNEIDDEDVACLMKKPSFMTVVEVSNMSTTAKGIELLKKSKKFYCPGKASNAGGVAVSGLEMSQNASMAQWSREEVDSRLKSIMKSIFDQCVANAKEYGADEMDLQTGANVSGFLKVANAMLEQGLY